MRFSPKRSTASTSISDIFADAISGEQGLNSLEGVPGDERRESRRMLFAPPFDTDLANVDSVSQHHRERLEWHLPFLRCAQSRTRAITSFRCDRSMSARHDVSIDWRRPRGGCPIAARQREVGPGMMNRTRTFEGSRRDRPAAICSGRASLWPRNVLGHSRRSSPRDGALP
jgi:hypothetical protein